MNQEDDLSNVVSGVFVVATTITWPNERIPSISVSKVVTSLLSSSPFIDERAPPRASISSIRIIAGVFSFALLNTSFITFSLSPYNGLNTSDPLSSMKFALISLLKALAIMVFPHPGGPQSNIPLGGLMP